MQENNQPPQINQIDLNPDQIRPLDFNYDNLPFQPGWWEQQLDHLDAITVKNPEKVHTIEHQNYPGYQNQNMFGQPAGQSNLFRSQPQSSMVDFRSEFDKRDQELAALQENPEDEPDFSELMESVNKPMSFIEAQNKSKDLSNLRQSIEVFDIDQVSALPQPAAHTQEATSSAICKPRPKRAPRKRKHQDLDSVQPATQQNQRMKKPRLAVQSFAPGEAPDCKYARYEPPHANDGTRIFYETLYAQNPRSKMAYKYLVEHGLLVPIGEHLPAKKVNPSTKTYNQFVADARSAKLASFTQTQTMRQKPTSTPSPSLA